MIIALNTGMRIGEILGLSLDELDFDNDLIYIKHQVQNLIIIMNIIWIKLL